MPCIKCGGEITTGGVCLRCDRTPTTEVPMNWEIEQSQREEERKAIAKEVVEELVRRGILPK